MTVVEHRERLKLVAGLTHLEQWAETAGQAAKNALYRMLFAVADGTVFAAYEVLDDVTVLGEYFVLVRPDLIAKIAFPRPGTFTVLFVGAPADDAVDGVGTG